MSVRVLAADGVTPVSGATIGWSAASGMQLSICSGASSCSVATDQSGGAATSVTPVAAGTATVTATLAPGVYNPAKSVNTTLNATETASDIGGLVPFFWIAQGATVSVPLTARLLSNGLPRNNAKVNFEVVSGSGTLSAVSAQTNSSGYATITLSLTQINSGVEVTACVAPANAPCQDFTATPVPLAQQNLQSVSGAGQVSTGPPFQPVVVRVTDSSSPAHPVLAATVEFLTTVLRPGGSPPSGGNGETNPTNPAMPVILSVSQNSATSDVNGLASLVPSGGGFSPPVEVDVAVTAGTTARLDVPLELLPALTGTTGNSGGIHRTPVGPIQIHIPRPAEITNP